MSVRKWKDPHRTAAGIFHKSGIMERREIEKRFVVLAKAMVCGFRRLCGFILNRGFEQGITKIKTKRNISVNKF